MISRGIAGFFGGFALLNLLGSLLAPGFDANLWWIDFSPLPHAIATVALSLGGSALLAYAVRPAGSARGRAVSAGLIAPLAVVALGDAIRFYAILHRHRISTRVPFPLSALVFVALGWIVLRIIRPSPAAPGRHGRAWLIGTIIVCLIAFPLGQMYFFGHTDYRRRADVIVVFGARAHADGSASDVLADRVRTACGLYREGCAGMLIFSGGPGDGAIDEPEAMRRLAVKAGVPENAILLDHAGLNTDATVRNTTELFRAAHLTRVLAVSHSYHLPRIKMSYHQAGWEVYTVPAVEHGRLPGGGRFLVARELAALGAYYSHPLWR
jgi:vancomycin permeability regulator SanA